MGMFEMVIAAMGVKEVDGVVQCCWRSGAGVERRQEVEESKRGRRCTSRSGVGCGGVEGRLEVQE